MTLPTPLRGQDARRARKADGHVGECGGLDPRRFCGAALDGEGIMAVCLRVIKYIRALDLFSLNKSSMSLYQWERNYQIIYRCGTLKYCVLQLV